MIIKALGVTLASVFLGIPVGYATIQDDRTILATLPCVVMHTAEAQPVPAICEMWTWQDRKFSTAYTINDRQEISTVEHFSNGSQKLYNSMDQVLQESAI